MSTALACPDSYKAIPVPLVWKAAALFSPSTIPDLWHNLLIHYHPFHHPEKKPMAEKDTSRSDVDRIRFAGDVEAGRQVRRPSLRRGSLRSEPVLANLSRRSSIEITAALPIQYRTV